MVSLSGNGGPAGTFKANLDMTIKSKGNTPVFYTSMLLSIGKSHFQEIYCRGYSYTAH